MKYEVSIFSCLKYLIKKHNPQLLKFVENYFQTYRFKADSKSLDSLIEEFEHFGIEIRVRKIKAKALRKQVEPVIAILKNGGACVIGSSKNNLIQILSSETSSDNIAQLDHKYFSDFFSGVILSVKFIHNKDSNTEEISPNKKKVVEKDDTGIRSYSWFWNVMSNYRGFYTHILLAAFFINVFALSIPLFTMNTYDRIIPNRTIDTLWALAIGVLFIVFFDFLMKMLRVFFVENISKKIDLRLSTKLLSKSLNMRMIDQQSSSGIRVSQLKDFDIVKDFISSVTIVGIIDLPFFILGLGVIYYIGGLIFLVPLSVFIIAITVSITIAKLLSDNIKKSLKGNGLKSAILYEALSNIEMVKNNCAQNYILNRWREQSIETNEISSKSKFLSMCAVNVITSLSYLNSIGIIIVGCYLVWKSELTVGGIIACSILSGRLIASIMQISTILTKYNQVKSSLSTLNNIMTSDCEALGFKKFYYVSDFKGDISFDSVSFSYDPEKGNFISNLSFKINRGEKVALLGNTGAGKSTIYQLITALYYPDEGVISIDQMNLHQIDAFVLRTNIGYIEQSPTLFSGTLWENIVFKHQEVSEELAMKAIKISGVERFAQKHPDGYNMIIREGGRGLSGGQKQAIAIARALLLDPPILLLDEPTSAMDANLERHFIENLSKYAKNKTLIISTHKNSLLELVDRVIIVDNGKIVEDSSKEKIFNLKKA